MVKPVPKKEAPVPVQKPPLVSLKDKPKDSPVIVKAKPKEPPVVEKVKPKEPPVIEKVKPKEPPPVVVKAKPKPPPVTQTVKPPPPLVSQVPKTQAEIPTDTVAIVKPRPQVFPSPPPIIATRANPLIKQIETEAGEIKLDLYDNGQIDGDTISVYHNNSLLVGNARLSEKAISFRITIDPAHPHHELIMVAHNLGSIPPNTSLMVITAGTKRYEVFISSNEQKNAKVTIDLKE